MTNRHQKPEILHVDDDYAFLGFLRVVLSNRFAITPVTGAAEALDILEDREFEMIITDYEMPEVNGLELLEILREKYPEIPVMFCTGHGSEHVARDAFVVGAVDYFTKELNSAARKEKLVNSIDMIITKRRVEKELREKERYYRSLIDGVIDLIIILDLDGTILYASPSTGKIVDYNPDEMKGKKIFEFIHGEDIERMERLIEEASKNLNKAPEEFGYRLLNRDGSHRYLEGRAKLIVDTSGDIRVVLHSIDVTKIFNYEQLLEQNRKLLQQNREKLRCLWKEIDRKKNELMDYRELLNYIPDIIYQLDSDGNVIFVNDAIKALGYEPEEVLGKHFSMLVHPRDLNEVSRSMVLPKFEGKLTGDELSPKLFDERRTGGRTTKSLKLRLRKNLEGIAGDDSQSEQVEAQLKICSSGNYDRDVKEEDKQFLGSLGIIKVAKATDEKTPRLEPQNKKNPDLKSLMDVIPDIVFRIDPQGNFTFINDEIKALGYEPKDLTGKHFSTLFPDEIVEQISRSQVLPDYIGKNTGDEKAPKLFDERRTGERRTLNLEVSLPVKAADGKNREALDNRFVFAEVSSSGYYDSEIYNGNKKFLGTIGIIRNISRQKMTEMELVKKNRELEDFSYFISHELKNPIEIIRGFLMNMHQKPESIEKYYKRISGQLDKMKTLINSILNLSKAGKITEDISKVDVEKLIKQHFVLLRTSQPEASIEFEGACNEIYAYREQLGVVFDNLLQNSFKYRDENKDRLNIKVSCEKLNEYAIIRYRDNGMGVNNNDVKRIFTPGFTSNKEKGTGFGLAIVKKIIDAHRGRIMVRSEGENKGVEFIISLPQGRRSQPGEADEV